MADDLQLTLAYLAGVIDSDGSISISLRGWRTKARNLSPVYSEHVAIGQCDPEAITLLNELFGGYIRIEKARREGRRPMYYWNATDKRAVTVLRALLPYLRIKRRQADLALRLREIKDRGREANTVLEHRTSVRNTRWGQRTYHRRLTSPEVLAEYETLANEVRALNDSRRPKCIVPLSNGETIPVVGTAL